MNKGNLWNKVLAFQFEKENDEYGFTVRLSTENLWTINFTEKAILEYKKFMYLAAVSDQMVSPSEIVDTVWHQHLIFTGSYNKFCGILGKQIQHVPSTHNKADYQAFIDAKDRTKVLYEKHFGLQDQSIWNYSSIFESLNLKKSKISLKTATILGINVVIALAIPFYYVLKPLYTEFDSAIFFSFLSIIIVISVAFLKIRNDFKLKEMVNLFDENSFVFDLTPHEIIYVKNTNLKDVLISSINKMLDDGSLSIRDKKIKVTRGVHPKNSVEKEVYKVISSQNNAVFLDLISILINKPLLKSISSSMNGFQKYFIKSQKFVSLFLANFCVLNFLFLLSFTRIITGLNRDKPVLLIVLFTLCLFIFILYFLDNLMTQFFRQTLPKFYLQQLINNEENNINLEWKYLISGTVILSQPLYAIINSSDSKLTYSGSDAGSGGCSGGDSGSGSSCGSSCDSSCGGCGGGD